MSLEALKREIFESANRRREEILKEAREKADKIVEEAKDKAERIIERKREAIIKELSEKKKAALAVARLEGKKKVLETRGSLVDKAFEEAKKKLIEIKDGKDYLNILIKFIAEAIKELGKDEVNIRVSSSDYEFMKKNLKIIEKNVSKKIGKKVVLNLIEEHVNIIGGVIVSSKGDQIIYTNSFDSRINRVYDEMRDEVIKILFGG